MSSKYTDFIDYLSYRASQKNIPLSGTFELTARCNLDCKMCYIHKRANDHIVIKSELSTEKWIETARDAQKAGMLLLLVTGGEPLIRGDFFELYDEFKKLGLSVAVNTNATLITEQIVKRFAENVPARLNITLYGASEETYSRLTGDAGAYKKVINALHMLKEAGIRVKLNYSLTPQNKCDFDKILDFAEENLIPLQPTTYMFPPVRACELCECSAVRVSPEESAEYYFRFDQRRMDKKSLIKRCETILAGNPIQEETECMELPTEKIRCRAGLTSFWMTYNGEMRPCGMMPVPTVSVNELGFDEAWRRIHAEREKIYFPSACTECSMRHACESCPATCYAENGDFTVVPKYNCEKTAAYLKILKKYLDEESET